MLKLALTAKWITALVLCLMMAAVFALLAQWQISRSVLPGSEKTTYSKVDYLSLDQISTPGKPFTFQEVKEQGNLVTLHEVTTRVIEYPDQAQLISDRIQLNGDKGYWVVVPARTEKANLFIAVGFIQEKVDAQKVLSSVREYSVPSVFAPVAGRYLPSEAPVESKTIGFASLSVAQLINAVSINSGTDYVYPGFLALTKSNKYTSISGVQPLTIGLAQSDGNLNWLSLFYGIEWTFFALFAIFMWWRLLADSYRKEQEELLKQNQ